jgi:hypothetical protein
MCLPVNSEVFLLLLNAIGTSARFEQYGNMNSDDLSMTWFFIFEQVPITRNVFSPFLIPIGRRSLSAAAASRRAFLFRHSLSWLTWTLRQARPTNRINTSSLTLFAEILAILLYYLRLLTPC